MHIAIVDIGTNSTRLLIAKVEGTVKILKTSLITTRLGEGIGSQPILLKAAMERTMMALMQFKELIDQKKVDKVMVAATSAVRDASNRSEFLSAVKLLLGWDVWVLSGEEEAEMSYLGVVSGLNVSLRSPIVIDIGGGSTEFIWSTDIGLNFTSVRLGAVRMAESGIGLKEIKEMLKQLTTKICLNGPVNLIGVGGTLTTLTAVDLGLDEYNPEKVHGYVLRRQKIKDMLARFEGLTLEERKKVPGLQPQRADIIVAGTRIALAVLEELHTDEIIVSETDILYGLLYKAIESK